MKLFLNNQLLIFCSRIIVYLLNESVLNLVLFVCRRVFYLFGFLPSLIVNLL